MRARVVRVNGTTEVIDLPEDTRAWLDAAYKAIGCTAVDRVCVIHTGPGRHGMDMWVDDEGLLNGAKPNIVAGTMLYTLTNREQSQPIMGDVIFTGGCDSEGDSLPLTKIQDAILSDMAADFAQQARRFGLVSA